MEILRRRIQNNPFIAYGLCAVLFVITAMGIHLHLQHHHDVVISSPESHHSLQIHANGIIDVNGHQDIDNGLIAGTLTKVDGDNFDFIVAILIVLLLLALPRQQSASLRLQARILPPLRCYFYSPPLRAPPLH